MLLNSRCSESVTVLLSHVSKPSLTKTKAGPGKRGQEGADEAAN